MAWSSSALQLLLPCYPTLKRRSSTLPALSLLPLHFPSFFSLRVQILLAASHSLLHTGQIIFNSTHHHKNTSCPVILRLIPRWPPKAPISRLYSSTRGRSQTQQQMLVLYQFMPPLSVNLGSRYIIKVLICICRVLHSMTLHMEHDSSA